MLTRSGALRRGSVAVPCVTDRAPLGQKEGETLQTFPLLFAMYGSDPHFVTAPVRRATTSVIRATTWGRPYSHSMVAGGFEEMS